MEFSSLVKGRLIRRYKRFMAEVDLDGERVVAHCANPGSMQTCAPEGAEVWLSPATNPKRKLKWSWEIVMAHGAMVGVHTGRANDLVAEAWELGRISELKGFTDMKREVSVSEKSRLDFCFSNKDKSCYVEVKNVSMFWDKKIAAFPDSVTERGTKHLLELIELKSQGIESKLLFLSTRGDTEVIVPADSIDPLYGKTLRDAAQKGVDILGYACDVSPKEIVVSRSVPVVL